MNEKDVIIIGGPTGVGKSSLAIKLAKQLNTEIISADSMQIYRGMDIGTAKVSQEEMNGVVHHLIDIVDPTDTFSVQEFQIKALKLIEDLHKQNKIPIIVGGTGLYIDSLVYDYDFLNVKPDYKLRSKLEDIYNDNPQDLFDKLLKIDKDNYLHLNIKDKKKIIRAIEVYELSGKIISYDRQPSNDNINYKLYVLNDNRHDLYERINKRVDIMLDQGLIDEVKGLIDKGLNKDHQAAKAIGYREVFEYFNDELSYHEMVEKLKQDSRRYAKRQLTWFRRNEYSRWYSLEKYSIDQIKDIILNKN